MLLQRLATGVKQARRGRSEPLVRACAVYTQRVRRSLALAVHNAWCNMNPPRVLHFSASLLCSNHRLTRIIRSGGFPSLEMVS